MTRDFSSRPRKAVPGLRGSLLLAAAVLAILFAARGALVSRRDLNHGRKDLDTVRAEIASGEAETRAAPRKIGSPGAVLSSRVLLSVGAPPPRVVAEVAALLPDDVRLLELSLVYGERLQLELRVEARSAGAYDAFLDRIQRSPLFAGVVPGAENRDGPVTATVRALYRGEGAP
jgi:hypothetical protein